MDVNPIQADLAAQYLSDHPEMRHTIFSILEDNPAYDIASVQHIAAEIQYHINTGEAPEWGLVVDFVEAVEGTENHVIVWKDTDLLEVR